jgi:hypothetical protein
MAKYEVLRDHFSIGATRLSKGDVIDDEVIGAAAARELEKAKRLRRVTADELQEVDAAPAAPKRSR